MLPVIENAPLMANLKNGIAYNAVHCTGSWVVRTIPSLEKLLEQFVWPKVSELNLDCSALNSLDTTGAWLLTRLIHEQNQLGCQITLVNLQPEFSSLIKLISAHAHHTRPAKPVPIRFLTCVGQSVWQHLLSFYAILSFTGETATSLFYSLAEPRRLRWRSILYNLQCAGFDALPIVGLLSFLLGLVIAYQGADQLQRFGANIFIADLVGLSMLRELSPLMTAIIVAGRSGSAYAAQIGTMKVTEEIDALRTIGIVPGELLVLPKLIALIIALPLLTIYADITSILGGMIMAHTQLDISPALFIHRLADAVSLASFLTGIGKAPVFAAIIALVGCYQGLQVSGSADSVGRQTTVSVVQAIFLVILSDALFSIAFNWLKI